MLVLCLNVLCSETAALRQPDAQGSGGNSPCRKNELWNCCHLQFLGRLEAFCWLMHFASSDGTVQKELVMPVHKSSQLSLAHVFLQVPKQE